MNTQKNPQEDLYKKILLKRWREAHFRRLTLPSEGEFRSHQESRSCGDSITMVFSLDQNGLLNAYFYGEGCSISVASADLAAEYCHGRPLKLAKQMCSVVLEWLDTLVQGQESPNPITDLSDMACLESLYRYPTRVSCARLAWQSAVQALNQYS